MSSTSCVVVLAGKTFRSIPAVKRHLGLAAPLRTGAGRAGVGSLESTARAVRRHVFCYCMMTVVHLLHDDSCALTA